MSEHVIGMNKQVIALTEHVNEQVIAVSEHAPVILNNEQKDRILKNDQVKAFTERAMPTKEELSHNIK